MIRSPIRRTYKSQVVVSSPYQLSQTLRSDAVYVLDGILDFTGAGYTITVPAGGLSIEGFSFDVSGLRCDDDNYSLFVSPLGGSGNLVAREMLIDVNGANSKVFDLTSATGFEAIEVARVNFNNCASRGEITNYRQGLEDGNGYFGGTPELTLSGNMIGGWRATTSIARGMNNMDALFKAGAGLSMGGRFITDLNCDLPASGALLDFSESNIVGDESLIIQGAFITRQGVIDASDTGLTPNINQDSVKSSWGDNTGIGNTQKYIKGECTAETVTTVAAANTYYPLLGAVTISDAVQFDSPANGQYRLLTGNGKYQITGDLTLAATANNQIDVRVAKSTDGGLTFPEEINHIGRTVNNLSGARDVAFMPLNFIADLKRNDVVRLEVENKTAANNITQELGSYLIITEV